MNYSRYLKYLIKSDSLLSGRLFSAYENQGKGEAIKTALQYIRAELWEYSAVGIMDADGQHLPEDMEKLLMRAGRNPGTLVLGTRNLDQSTPWKSRFCN